MIPHPRNTQFFIGHKQPLSILKNEVNQPTHSWMFDGRPGVGKATLAYHFIKYILSNDAQHKNIETLEVYQNDQVHKLIGDKIHPDFTVVEPTDKASISIDQVRKAVSKLYNRPAVSSFNILLIDNAEKLNNNSANLLLKTLEEPPKYAVIILLCNRNNTLPKTISSRCRKINFSALSQEEVKGILKNIFPDISDEESSTLATVSDGSVGDAAMLYNLDQGISDKLETYRSIISLLSKKPSVNQLASELLKQDIEPLWQFIRIIFPRFFILPVNYLVGSVIPPTINEEVIWLKNIKTSAQAQMAVKSYSTAMAILNDAEIFDLDKRASLIMLLDILVKCNEALLK